MPRYTWDTNTTPTFETPEDVVRYLGETSNSARNYKIWEVREVELPQSKDHIVVWFDTIDKSWLVVGELTTKTEAENKARDLRDTYGPFYEAVKVDIENLPQPD